MPDSGWERYPHEKKKILDPVLQTLTGEQAERVRAAILESEKAGVTARYKAFLLNLSFWPFSLDPGSSIAYQPGLPLLDQLQRYSTSSP